MLLRHVKKVHQLQASNRFTPLPFVNQAFVFSFFVSWVALFVDAGLTQFVPIAVRAPLIAAGGRARGQ
jgi:hypothetical protein